MTAKFCLIVAASLVAGSAAAAVESGPTDPQIAHIAYTADNIDIDAGKLALQKSRNPALHALWRHRLPRLHGGSNLG
ncbi:MAG TPA: hypothetical protein VFH89_13790 [Sphingomicrobium sp.]|nr:hypothetical protein [Sphingomicrobium sp.]